MTDTVLKLEIMKGILIALVSLSVLFAMADADTFCRGLDENDVCVDGTRRGICKVKDDCTFIPGNNCLYCDFDATGPVKRDVVDV